MSTVPAPETPQTAETPATAAAPDAAWEAVLDRLEADVALAEGLTRGPQPVELAAWEPPALDTTLPAYLVDRARALLRRQEALLHELPLTQERLRRQQAVTTRIRQATGRSATVPVYIDASA